LREYIARAIAGLHSIMTYPQHWLLAFGGNQGDLEEIWACGIRLVIDSVDPQEGVDEEQYLTNTAVPALTAWMGRAASKIAAACQLTWVKMNEIGPDGKYADQSQTHERQGLLISGGGGSTQLHPLQVCAVLSWRSNEAERGFASRGRIYSPRPAVAVGVSGDVAGADRVLMAESARDLLNALDVSLGIVGGTLRPHIVSRGPGPAPWVGQGESHPIDRVVVDSSLDIQRRRSNHQSKEVTSVAVVYT